MEETKKADNNVRQTKKINIMWINRKRKERRMRRITNKN